MKTKYRDLQWGTPFLFFILLGDFSLRDWSLIMPGTRLKEIWMGYETRRMNNVGVWSHSWKKCWGMKPNINFLQIFLVIWYDVLFPWIQLILAYRTINDIKTWNHWKCFQFLMPLYKLLCHYYNTKVIFQGCTQAMAHSGKSELQMQNINL